MRREALLWTTAIGALAFLSTHAFTGLQRDWLKRRDQGKCQAPFPHTCDEKNGCELHHIIPQAYAKRVSLDPDYPENGLTLCHNAHQRIIHQDSNLANKLFKEPGARDTALFAHRAELMEQRQVYWNDTYDRELLVLAARRTQEHKKQHPDDQWPEKGAAILPTSDQTTPEPPTPRTRTRI